MSYTSIIWEVIHGKALGRTIGFPTANIEYTHGSIWAGTYGLSGIIDGALYYGIGVYLPNEWLFEAHFFDFFHDIYGETISVTPLFLIRENQRFSSIEELKAQIEKDREVMRGWMKTQ